MVTDEEAVVAIANKVSDPFVRLRAPFPDSAIGKLPRAGIHLDYVGHAAVTDRLLQVDPTWTWEPVAWAADGTPLWTVDAGNAVMWIRLTVCGVSRLGVGIVQAKAFELEKQLISDALRNAAMRFGVALDLWSKEDLSVNGSGPVESGTTTTLVDDSRAGNNAEAPPSAAGESAGFRQVTPDSPAPFSPGKASLDKATARASALHAIGVDITKERDKRKLPKLRELRDEKDWHDWTHMLAVLEKKADSEADAAAKAGAAS